MPKLKRKSRGGKSGKATGKLGLRRGRLKKRKRFRARSLSTLLGEVGYSRKTLLPEFKLPSWCREVFDKAQKHNWNHTYTRLGPRLLTSGVYNDAGYETYADTIYKTDGCEDCHALFEECSSCEAESFKLYVITEIDAEGEYKNQLGMKKSSHGGPDATKFVYKVKNYEDFGNWYDLF